MTTLAKGIPAGWLAQPRAESTQRFWGTYGHSQLDRIMETAPRVDFDDSARIVLFSDCHRGDGSRADAFSRNEDLFLGALEHYYREGFSYVEIGDGDELWQNRRFRDIRQAHARTFDLLHRFDLGKRLHIIVGNHDVQGLRFGQVEKDGMPTLEGLVLRQVGTGQHILVTHGHQADFKSDRLRLVGKLVVRHIWKRLQLHGLVHVSSHLDAQGASLAFVERRVADAQQATYKAIERRLMDWVVSRQQIVICGHTHRPAFPARGMPAYFNAGSCVNPGYITGLEIQGGDITLVRWCARGGPGADGTPHIERQLLAPPRRLSRLN
jgi:UDP-2,3-diacylglucosamine pyrophosphatase LpxH